MKQYFSWLFLILASVTFGVTGADGQGKGEAYPQKPISLIIGYSPGGSTDITGKIVAEMLKEKLGVPVIIEYKPGASQALATSYLMKQEADGYTLIWTAQIDFLIKYLQDKEKLDYSPDKLDILGGSGYGPYFWVVNSDSPYKSVNDLIEFAKKNPGKITYSTSGVGSTQELMTKVLSSMTKAKFTHVPYNGGGPALTALVGKHVDMHFSSVGRVKSYIEAGNLRALASCSKERYTILPNVPTLKEQGIDLEEAVFHVLFAKKGTSPHILQAVNKAFQQGLKESKYANMMSKTLYLPIYMSPEDLKNTFLEKTRQIEDALKN